MEGRGKGPGVARLVRGASVFAVLVLALLAHPALSADGAPSVSDASSLVLGISFSGTASVSGAPFETMEFTTKAVPATDERQQASCSVATSGGIARFSWEGDSPAPAFSYSCNVSAGRIGARFDGTEKFPFQAPPEVAKFVGGSEKVRLSPEIVSLSRETVGNTESEFEALERIGAWVHKNIKYDSSYFGRSLPSDQVLRERAGVCEEFAHLFIAMARSVGIPTRYVYGYVWGVSQDRSLGESFGPHGWAEAYFLGRGWVPFDPTFGQFGYVDASHVKFYTSMDSAESEGQRKFTYTGEVPDIKWSVAHPAFSVLSRGADQMDAAVTSVSATPDKANAGEYVLVSATVKSSVGIPSSPQMGLTYKAGNVPEDENMQLVYDGSGGLILAPSGTGEARYVLQARGAGYIFPVMVGVLGRGKGMETEIEVHDKPPRATASFSGGKVAVRGPAGSYQIVGLSDGRRAGFSIGSSGYSEIPLAGFYGPVFLTTGNYLEIPKPTETVSIEVPQFVYQDEGEINATISSSGGTAVSGRTDGQTFTVPGGSSRTITIKAPSSGVVEFFVGGAGGAERKITRAVQRIPRPDASVDLPETVDPGTVRLSEIVKVANGRLVSASFESDSGSSETNDLVLSAGSCKDISVAYTVSYEDLGGRPQYKEGVSVVRTWCSGGFLDILARFFEWLFGKG